MAARQPFFSVIVPTHDRPEALNRCLDAVSRSSYPRHLFQVIVVDDGSDSPPTGLSERFGSLPLTLLRHKHAGPAAARNAGAAEARGDFLAFTDDDCAPAEDWLDALARSIPNGAAGALAGRTVNALPGNAYSTATQLLVDAASAFFNAEPERARFFNTSNVALPAKEFRAIGGFDPSIMSCEDRELCERWLAHGYGLTYSPGALVHHAHALTMPAFTRQHFDYGRGALSLSRSRARHGVRPARPETRLHLDFVRRALDHGRRTPLLVTLVALSQLFYLAGFSFEAARYARASVARRPRRRSR